MSKVERVKVKDIPLTESDEEYIFRAKARVSLLEDIRKKGIKYPISVYSMTMVHLPRNIDKGHGRMYAAKVLGIEEVDIVIVKTSLKKRFGSDSEVFKMKHCKGCGILYEAKDTKQKLCSNC